MRDEENRAAAFPLRLHDREDALGQIRGQRGRDLVEDQQPRVACERAREVEHAQHRQGHVEYMLAEVDVEVELVQAPPHRADRRAGEPHVLLDAEVRHERGILEHRREPDPRRLRRRGDAHRAPSTRISPASGADHARQHLDERALAGAVRAEERVHLPRLDHERRRPQSHHRAVALRDLACGEEAHACAEGRMPLGTLPSFALSAYGPLQPDELGRACTSYTA